MNASATPLILSRRKIAGLLLAQAFIIMPLLVHIPLWICGLWMAIALWRWQMLRDKWFTPHKYLINVITIGCAAGLYVNFTGRAGMDAALALLICTFILKILEMRNLRDAQLIVFIGFIAISTQLLLSQTIGAAVYALICSGILMSSWRGIYLHRNKPFKQSLRRNLGIFFQTIPILLVLFIVLPRIGPLWTMPEDQVPKSGFTDNLSLGDLGELVKNHDAAFRVSFDKEKPNHSDLYWRGLVLNQYDGKTWTYNNATTSLRTETEKTSSDLIDYKIILEAHGYRWLFALSQPARIKSEQNNLRINREGLVRSSEIIRQRMQYEVSSTTRSDIYQELSDVDKNTLLALPENSNPQTRQLVAQWLAEGLTTDDIIAEMQNNITREFSYTLQPPALGTHSIDDFLFKTKSGFCEHFASSFAFVMRSAGVPSRVVVGYQGGTWNEIEQYLLVSQADAHAWVEIWIDNHWRRIDPTAFVAPGRVESGIDEALTQNDQQLLSRRWQQSPWLWQFQKRWDAASFVWYKFVINYDKDNQQRFIENILGGSDPWRLVFSLVGLMLFAAALIASVFWFRNRRIFSADYEKVVYLLEKKLKKRGYQRYKGESISAFCKRVGNSEPLWNQQLHLIAEESVNAFYASPDTNQERLKKLIRLLK
jgi:protein-glutamine gamma-glutamyltransferase